MSLQYDFERCLEYAEKLEDRQERRVNAQNNIIFVRNESERLKNKLKILFKKKLLLKKMQKNNQQMFNKQQLK